MASALNEPEQFLLQYFLNVSIIDQYNFKEVFRRFLQKFNINYNRQDSEQLKTLLTDYIKRINACIKNYSLEIKNGACELTGTKFYCMVRIYDSNSIGSLSQLYTANELKIFKTLLNAFIESEEGVIDASSIASQLVEQLELKCSMKEVNNIIDKFVRDNWLAMNAKNELGLHGRAVLELSQYLLEVYGSELINNCKLCKEIVISGISCENCAIKMHRHCAKKYFKGKADCIACKKPFTSESLSTLVRDNSQSSQLNYTQQNATQETFNSTQTNASKKRKV